MDEGFGEPDGAGQPVGIRREPVAPDEDGAVDSEVGEAVDGGPVQQGDLDEYGTQLGRRARPGRFQQSDRAAGGLLRARATRSPRSRAARRVKRVDPVRTSAREPHCAPDGVPASRVRSARKFGRRRGRPVSQGAVEHVGETCEALGCGRTGPQDMLGDVRGLDHRRMRGLQGRPPGPSAPGLCGP
ncbi:hypothetical protein NKH18_15345 [Streptomyces sp. M10(2022)]